MANYISFRDGGKTDQQGIFRWFTKMFTQGNPTIDSATTLQVSQRGAGANMSVDIAIGDVHIPYTTFSFYGFTDAIVNKSISAADPTNPRRDIVVAYVDLSVVNSASNDNPNALNFAVVAGTPAGSPTDPSGATIQAAVGSGNPYVQLARIAVAASASSIVNANITDLRQPIAVKANLWGGGSNTNGHVVPNVADDTVALLNASQTLANKTFTAPVLNNPVVSGDAGWQSLGLTPNTITANGNKSYSLIFNAVDKTGTLYPGMRIRATRTVAAPSQCTSLNGSTQFYNKTTPAGMTFTDDMVGTGWVKLTSYGAVSSIASRYNGTSGWDLHIETNGQITLAGYNAGSANFSDVVSYQSIPLNKWVHVAAQLDMSSFTATPTTSYVMIDGIDVPASVARAGTNPTALVQAGNLEIGSRNAGTQPFPGKLAQVAIYSAKVTQATILASINQTLTGSETSLISAYSFNNSINDLNVSNANNLTANGAAVATNADSPFAQAVSAGTLEYGIATAVTFSTNTTVVVQVPEGSAIPTSGGVSAISYSLQKIPYGLPIQHEKWTVEMHNKADGSQASPTNSVWYNVSSMMLNVPIGAWNLGYEGICGGYKTGSQEIYFKATLSTANNSESDPTFTTASNTGAETTTTVVRSSVSKRRSISLSSATPYYANIIAPVSSTNSIDVEGAGFTPWIIKAENAFL